jgi:hypothetical protein
MQFYSHNHDLAKGVQNLTYSYEESRSIANGARIKWDNGE